MELRVEKISRQEIISKRYTKDPENAQPARDQLLSLKKGMFFLFQLRQQMQELVFHGEASIKNWLSALQGSEVELQRVPHSCLRGARCWNEAAVR